jgi:hypothetical protein
MGGSDYNLLNDLSVDSSSVKYWKYYNSEDRKLFQFNINKKIKQIDREKDYGLLDYPVRKRLMSICKQALNDVLSPRQI